MGYSETLGYFNDERVLYLERAIRKALGQLEHASNSKSWFRANLAIMDLKKSLEEGGEA